MPWEVQHQHGVNLPQIGWWLDAQKSQARSFVSHAHSDHIASHREIIATRETASLMRLRVGGRREEHILGFGEPFTADVAVCAPFVFLSEVAATLAAGLSGVDQRLAAMAPCEEDLYERHQSGREMPSRLPRLMATIWFCPAFSASP